MISDILPIIIQSVVVLVLLFGIALISAFGSAIHLMQDSDLKHLHEHDESTREHRLKKLLSNEELLYSSLLFLKIVFVIIVIILLFKLTDILLPDTISYGWSITLKIIISFSLILLLGEMIPRFYAAQNYYRTAISLTTTVYIITYAIRPFVKPFANFAKVIIKISSREDLNVSIDELQEAIDIAQTEDTSDSKMLSEIVRFSNTLVDEIMTPRVDVTSIDIDTKYDEVQNIIVTSGYSRIPVYKDSMDNIQGILFVKDLIPYFNKEDDFDWYSLLRKPFYVPEHKKINDLLEEFQEKKVHFAVVIDEYGGTLGIVTMEDILEEIVGEISDEADSVHSFYRKISDTTYVFEGKTPLRDCKRVLDLSDDFFDDIKEEADTIAGLMLEIKGDFFDLNDSVEYRGVKFIANKIVDHRIIEVQIVLNEEGEKNE